MTYPFDSGKDWTFADIDHAYEKIREIAEEMYGLTYYPNQIEIITSEQMLDCYSSIGMPVYYSHWSFGKQFVEESEQYKKGRMGLAYEIVINSNPCISYLMEENTMMMQCLVMAHACFGHNSFFKNNVTFQQWTDPSAIIDYLAYAKHYIAECEEKYGIREVESVIDSAHALRYQGIDRYKRPPKPSKHQQDDRIKARQLYQEQTVNELWKTLPYSDSNQPTRTEEAFEPEENLLYFIEKNAPHLEQWKREILRIVRKTSQYFYPQMLTKVMNEGWATFTHYNITQEMYARGYVTEGFMMEFIHSHSGVVAQRKYGAFNPYALGFAMFNDIKRICLEPTKEDERWFPELCGKSDWLAECKKAAYTFKDESFILQYLSPKVMRDFQMFYVLDDDRNPTMRVEAIQDDEGYKVIREKLSNQQNVNNTLPYINVTDVDFKRTRMMTVDHTVYDRRTLEYGDAVRVQSHLAQLWQYPVMLRSVDPNGLVLDQSLMEVVVSSRDG